MNSSLNSLISEDDLKFPLEYLVDDCMHFGNHLDHVRITQHKVTFSIGTVRTPYLRTHNKLKTNEIEESLDHKTQLAFNSPTDLLPFTCKHVQYL